MSQLDPLLEQASLSLASYANLSASLNREETIPALREAGMSSSQAELFASDYTIIDRYQNSTGLSATVFEDTAGKRYLAVRGSDSLGDMAANAYILSGWPRSLNTQFAHLWQQVDNWIESGVLPARFTVSGHSLGGYLAAGIGSSFGENVEAVYMFNAPGTKGLGGNVLASLGNFLGISDPPADNVFNVRAAPGLSVAAALGLQPSPPIFIESEASANPLSPFENHRIAPLTDALAIYDVFSRLEAPAEQSGPQIEAIGELLRATSGRANATLETALDSLRTLFSQATEDTATEVGDRDAFYLHLQELAEWIAPYEGQLQVEALTDVDADVLAALAQADDGIAYRHALEELNPFAILDQENVGLYEDAGDAGIPTDAYLEDRADLLVWKNLNFSRDGNIALRDARIETVQYSDLSWRDAATGQELLLTVSGTQHSAVISPIKIIFGGDEAESIVGGDVAAGDRLYAGEGADTLEGAGGSDYLEGGGGIDTYVWNTGDGFDTILDADGAGKLVVNGGVISSAIQITESDYITGDKAHLLHFEGDLTAGGVLVIDGEFEIEGFKTGHLGIEVHAISGFADLQPTESTFADRAPSGVAFGTSGADRFLQSSIEDLFSGLTNGNFHGGIGDDLFEIQAGEVYAGGGDDLVVLSTAEAYRSTVAGDSGSDYILGGAGDDALRGDFTGHFESSGFILGTFRCADGGEGGMLGFHVDPLSGAESEALAMGADYLAAVRYALGIGESSASASLYDDFIDGGAGNDRIAGDLGSDVIFGGAGSDQITDEYSGAPTFAAGLGTALRSSIEELLEAGSDDYLDGGDGDDEIQAGQGDDVLAGGEGSDYLSSSISGHDILTGGAGNDILQSLDNASETETYCNFLEGGDGDDDLLSWNSSLNGLDTLLGGLGNDTLTVYSSDGYMEGGDGSDSYTAVYDDSDALPEYGILIKEWDEAEADVDSLTLFMASAAIFRRDELNLYIGPAALPGWVTIEDWFSEAAHKIESILISDYVTAGQSFDIAAVESRFTTATSGADFLWGSEGGDQLAAGSDADTVFGAGGDDVLEGQDGNDRLVGGEGGDTLDGGAGADALLGGVDDDTYVINDAGNAVTEATNEGTDTVRTSITYTLDSNVENLVLSGAKAVNGTGNGLDNVLTGNAGKNKLDGKGGIDNLEGLGGEDTLVWGGNAERYDGGAGKADRIKLESGRLDLTRVDDANIRDIEQIDMTGGRGNRLTLKLSDLLSISSTTNTLKVLGDAGDSIDIVGKFTRQGASGGFRTYKMGNGTLLVDTDIVAVG